ncbi:MAG: peptidylprolyl isomerase [Eubacteriaceae bacterium]|jgi:peptidyl-prolyl cis-trans isomerase C
MEQKPLAVVNGKNIYASNLDTLINQLPPDQQQQFKTREGRRQLLDELIAQDLFYLEAKENKLEDTPEFKEILKDTEEKLLKSMSIAEFMKQIDVTDEEIQKFYDDNPKMFLAPESVRASHILVPAEQQAKDIIGEIKEGKKSFEQAAKDYSTCPSKENGGDLSYFQKGRMVPQFEDAAFAMEPGQMTDEPVKTDFGYHIIKVTDKQPEQPIPFEAAKEEVRRHLLGQKQNDAYLKHVEELKEKYPVEMSIGLI